MDWRKYILTFLALFYSLLASNTSSKELIMQKIDDDKIQLSFNLSEQETRNQFNGYIYNYILELDSESEFEFYYSVNSTYQSNISKKQSFKPIKFKKTLRYAGVFSTYYNIFYNGRLILE